MIGQTLYTATLDLGTYTDWLNVESNKVVEEDEIHITLDNDEQIHRYELNNGFCQDYNYFVCTAETEQAAIEGVVKEANYYLNMRADELNQDYEVLDIIRDQLKEKQEA